MTSRGYLTAARPGLTARLRSWAIFALGVAFTGAVTVGLLRVVDEPTFAVAVAIPLLAALGVAMFAMPVHMLPSVALAVIALVPTRLVPSGGPFNALPPLAIVMAIWVLRRLVLDHRGPRTAMLRPLTGVGPRLAVYTTAIMLVVWLMLSTFRAGFGDTSVGWTIAFTASALLPLLVFDAREEVALLRKVLLVVGAVVGANVFIEMMLGTSPIYGLLALLSGGERTFGFAVYRARGPFSHPLFAGAFLTIPALVGIGTWLTTGRRWTLVCGLLAAAGVLGTVSRGSLLALGLAVGVAVVVAPFFTGWKNINRWFALLGLAVVSGIVVLNFGPLLERSDSIESQLSAGVRDRAVDVALDAAAYGGWFGTGPGTSGQTGRLFDSIIIENSLLQLLISIGVPGLLLFLAFVASLIWTAWARGDLGAGLAVIGYVVAVTGFNSLDAVRNMHLLIGILVLLAVHDSEALAERPRAASALPDPRLAAVPA
jgi:hypothetical protein